MTGSAILYADRAAVDVYVQFHFLFEQFHVLGSIHSGVRWNETQTSSATARQHPKSFGSAGVFHCACNIFLVKTLTHWPPNVNVARYKLLLGAFIKKQNPYSTQRESNGDDV